MDEENKQDSQLEATDLTEQPSDMTDTQGQPDLSLPQDSQEQDVTEQTAEIELPEETLQQESESSALEEQGPLEEVALKTQENTDQGKQLYKSAIEALLFVSDKPIVVDQFKSVFPELKPSEIAQLVRELQDEYVNRQAGMMIVDIANGWQMLSNSNAAPYIREFYKTKTKEKLSRPSLESLAIIAYKQPVSRGELESIRGVNCDGTVAHLLNKGLIEIVGRKEVAGRPFLYGTTKAFLEYFGLRSLNDLPKLEQFPTVSQDEAGQTQVITAGGNAVIQDATLESATQETSGQSRMMDNGQVPSESLDQSVVTNQDEASLS